MKKLLILYFTILNFSELVQAQTQICTEFTISSVMPDSNDPNSFQISIQNNRNASEMVNYPHVAFVMDCNGDTLAYGTLFWFGQFGQTTQDYPVTLTGNGSINCLPLSAFFVISDNSGNADTCQLVYSTTNISYTSDPENITIYPNPASNEIFINLDQRYSGRSYSVYNYIGEKVLSGYLNSFNSPLDISKLHSGTYFLEIDNKRSKAFTILKY